MAPSLRLGKSSPAVSVFKAQVRWIERGSLTLQVSALGCALLGAGAVSAQDVRSGGITVSPSVSVTETLTDNLRLTATDKLTDAVTQLTASLRVDSRTGRVQGSLDYALTGFVYARGNGSANFQNNLNGQFRADVIDNWLTLDGRAQVGQQAISAFGTQSFDPALGNGNRTEVRSYQLTPAVHGSLASWADYQASLSHGSTRTSANDERGNVDTSTGFVSLSSPRGAIVGWQAAASRTHADYLASRATDSDTATLTLSYAPAADWRVHGSFGRESNNYGTQDMKGNATWGAGAEWSPSTNLRVSGQVDHRFFGNGHQFSLEYRLPRSVIRLTSSRDVTDPASQTTFGALATAYDLYYAQFASLVPDPIKRDQVVRGYLQAYGISPTAQLATGFLPSAAMLQSRTELSYAVQGVRSNVTLSVAESVSNRIDRLATGVDDLSNGDRVRQRSYSVAVGHRLTPVTGLSLQLSRQDTSGDNSTQSNALRSISLNLTTSLGLRSTASLAARHVVFDSTTQPYTENALIATFGLRF